MGERINPFTSLNINPGSTQSFSRPIVREQPSSVPPNFNFKRPETPTTSQSPETLSSSSAINFVGGISQMMQSLISR